MWNQDRLLLALDFAARAHGRQVVPGSGFPYVVHATKVATEVLGACLADPGTDIDFAVTCALLHDCLEDTPTRPDEIASAFGAPVLRGVQALTKNSALPKDTRMADSLGRIRTQPREVWMVKLGDRITNLEPPPPAWTLDKRRAYAAEARQILDTLRGASPSLERRLEQRLTAYDAWCR